MFNLRLHYLLLAAILLYALVIRTLFITQPFHTTAEGIGSFYGIQARNYLRIPWHEHKGIPVQNSCYHPGTPLRFYSHHPPLIPLTVALSYKIFGQGDWQTRLPFALSTLGATFLIYLLLKKSNPTAALYASAIFASLPIVLYYGAQPEFLNPQFVFLTLLTTLAFFHFNSAPTIKSLALLCAGFTLAAATDWPAFYLAPLASIFFYKNHKTNHWPLLLAFLLYSALFFVTLYAHITLVATHDWSWIIHELRARTLGQNPVSPSEWLKKAWYYNSTHHTLPILILSTLYLFSLLKTENRKSKIENSPTLFLLLFALIHLLIGLRGAYDHAWWWWPLTPFLALSAGLALSHLNYLPPKLKLPAHTLTIFLLIFFSALNLKRVLPEFLDPNITADGQPYDAKMLARAVRFAAPGQNNPVILISGDIHPSLWYYADRPIKMHIWSISEFNERLTDTTVDLPFAWTQECPDRPVAVVIPKLYINAAKDLHQHLRATYKQLQPPPDLAALYEIYLLPTDH